VAASAPSASLLERFAGHPWLRRLRLLLIDIFWKDFWVDRVLYPWDYYIATANSRRLADTTIAVSIFVLKLVSEVVHKQEDLIYRVILEAR